jgi:hypothetical protein
MDISTGLPVQNRYVNRDIPKEFVNGVSEMRSSKLPTEFSSELYLAANPDVKAAGVDPITHYLQFGAREGRKLRPEGVQRETTGRIRGVVRGLGERLRLKHGN